SSNATNLISGQTGQSPALFLFDRIAGTLTLVSRSAVSPNDRRTASEPAISADGHFIAFASSANDLAPGQIDTSSGFDYFLYDRVAGSTALVSHVPASEITSAGGSGDAARVSAD